MKEDALPDDTFLPRRDYTGGGDIETLFQAPPESPHFRLSDEDLARRLNTNWLATVPHLTVRPPASVSDIPTAPVDHRFYGL